MTSRRDTSTGSIASAAASVVDGAVLSGSTGAASSGILADRRLRSLGRLILATLSGSAVGFAFQPYALWPLGFLGVAGLSVAVRKAPARRGFAAGYDRGAASRDA